MRQRILITGAGGFLAGALRRELEKRYPQALLLLTDHHQARGSITCELLDPEEVRRLIANTRPTTIFHLAGTTHLRDWDGLWKAHVSATMTLLESVRLYGDPNTRIVLSGSSSEYGAPSKKSSVSENSALEPLTRYGSTKLAQAQAALAYRHHGLKISVARIFNVMGPGMPENLALGTFARQIALIEEGRQAPRLKVGNLTSRRDYIDVRDVARGLADIAHVRPGVYNIASGRSRSLAQLLDTMLSFSHRKITVTQDAGRVRKNEVRDIRGSHARLTRASGWQPRVSIRESLRDTLEWHRDQH